MTELEDFYGLLDELRERVGGERRLSDSDARSGWPDRGVSFFFEEGEVRPNGLPRVVRVGTHALRAGSQTTLWKRLSQHRGNVGGRRPGGGNHRGSVFRLHVGQCLLARDGDPYGVADSWGDKSTAAQSVRTSEYPHEQAVSRLIGRMPFLWVEIDDSPGPASERALVEAGAIALLSGHVRSDPDTSSATWLGRWSSRTAVRASGLWNVNHVAGPRLDFLEVLERRVRMTR